MLAVHRLTACAQAGGKELPTVASKDSQAIMHLRQAWRQESYEEGVEREDMTYYLSGGRRKGDRKKSLKTAGSMGPPPLPAPGQTRGGG